MAHTTSTITIKAGDKVEYCDFSTPLEYTVTEVTTDGRLHLRLGSLGELPYTIPAELVTLIWSAPEPATAEPTPADGTIGSTATLDGTPVVIVAQPGSSGYRPAARNHRCHLGIDCHYMEIAALDPTQAHQVPMSAWLCELDTDLVEQATATAAVLGMLPRRPVPARTGTRMSTTAANMIADLGCGAQISRGRGHGRLDVTQLRCLHDRGYVVAVVDPQQPTRITGAVITGKGVQRALQLVTYTLAA